MNTYRSILVFHTWGRWTLFLEMMREEEAVKGQPGEASSETNSLTTSNLIHRPEVLSTI